MRTPASASNRVPVKKKVFSAALVPERWARPCYDLSCGYDLARILFSSSRESLVRLVGLKFGCDVVDGFVNVELFAAENVHERMLVVREGVNTEDRKSTRLNSSH